MNRPPRIHLLPKIGWWPLLILALAACVPPPGSSKEYPPPAGGDLAGDVPGDSHLPAGDDIIVEHCDDPDGDGYGEGSLCLGPDCAPDDGDRHPGVTEICDEIDNDCDLLIDEGLGCQALPRLWVIILAGQSNMVGLGTNSEISAVAAAEVPGAHIYYEDGVHSNANANVWRHLKAGFGVTATRFGPELSFGRRLRQAWPNRTIALIKVAESATALHDRWRAGSGDLYQLLVNTVQTQMASLAVTWRPQLVGMIWMQGESDAFDPHADAYESNLRDFVTSLRVDLEQPLLPFVAGLIAPQGGWPEAETVRSATRAVASQIGPMDVVETNDLAMIPTEVVHYNSASLLTLGNRFADAFAALLAPASAFPAQFSPTPGDGFWTYGARLPGGSFVPLTYSNALGRWHVDAHPEIYIANGSMHPGTHSQAELVWRAPFRGRAQIDIGVWDQETAGGDGADIEIVRGGDTVLRPTPVPASGTQQAQFVVDVLQNDELRFRTSAGVNHNNDDDTTGWTVDIDVSPDE